MFFIYLLEKQIYDGLKAIVLTVFIAIKTVHDERGYTTLIYTNGLSAVMPQGDDVSKSQQSHSNEVLHYKNLGHRPKR